MAEISKERFNISEFRNTISEYSDDEIMNILKKRNQYQPEAAEAAIEEALKRKLIHSEQDFFSKEFEDKPIKFSLYPTIENDSVRIKIRKSIARVLLITGVIPLIWGVLQIIRYNEFEGILLALLGAIWTYASIKILQSGNLKMINVIFIMLLASMAYIIKLISGVKNLVIMDFFIPVILFLLITYGLFFIKRLSD